MSNDAHTLTGAYVLDALSEVERRAFEEHMAVCPACSQEVAELRETTARLGTATATVPPPELWGKVHVATTQARQLPPVPSGSVVTPRPRRWPMRIAVFTAAASLLAAAGIGIALTNTNRDLENQLAQTQSRLDKVRAVLGAADAQFSRSPATSGGTAMAVMSRSANGLVVMVRGLPPLPAYHTYQAWYVTDSQKISAGLLGESNGAMMVEDLTVAKTARALAFTVEPTGGSAQPSTNALVAVPMPT